MGYRRLGRLVPRDAHEQEAAAEALEEGDLKARRPRLLRAARARRPHRFLARRGADSPCNGARWGARGGRGTAGERPRRARASLRPPLTKTYPGRLHFAKIALGNNRGFQMGRCNDCKAKGNLVAGRSGARSRDFHDGRGLRRRGDPLTCGAATRAEEFGTLRAVLDTIDFLDPQQAYTGQSWWAMWNVYETLLTYKHVDGPAGYQLVPGLAQSLPKISSNGRVYKFTLRTGLEVLERQARAGVRLQVGDQARLPGHRPGRRLLHRHRRCEGVRRSSRPRAGTSRESSRTTRSGRSRSSSRLRAVTS